MATSSGTATNYLDLLDKLRVFVTTNATLVADGEEWVTERWTGGNELILRGPGLSGDKEIFVGFKGDFSVGGDYYNLECRGFTDYNSLMTFSGQPGASQPKYLSLWNSSIPYWFVANGQRIIVIAKVSTTYHLGYFGFYLPYGQPSAFPYPLVIAASCGTQGTRWSSTLNSHANLTGTTYETATPSGNAYSACYYSLEGVWYPFSRIDPGASYQPGWGHIWPYSRTGQTTGSQMTEFRRCPDNTYWLLPCVIMQGRPAKNLMGELDGVFACTGFGLAVEDTITSGGVSHLAVQNIFRTGYGDYVAVKMQ